MRPQLGIFLCTCDGKIESRVQVDAFQYVMRGNEDVALVKPFPHLCLPDGIHELQSAIRQNHLERVVVAACPARLQEKSLRAACVAVGVNPNHFALVDWREGCVNAHSESKPILTGKAIDLIQMGVARVSNADPIKPVTAQISSNVLVIGGGIAGMTAARALADRGIEITLVERGKELGGQLRGASLNGASDVYRTTLDAVKTHPNVQVLFESHIVSVSGTVGNYHVGIAGAGTAVNSVIASEAKQSRLQVGSVIASTQNMRLAITEFAFGAIVVATGAQEFRQVGLYRYDGRRVVTLNEFESEISTLQSPVSLVYILCAGSRDEYIPYCSNVCCLNALNQAIRFKRTQLENKVTILFRDLYLLGDEMNEEIVRDARRAGIVFVRYALAQPPHVSKDAVEVYDALTSAMRHIHYDRVVLATALVPRQDAGMLARLLKIDRDDAGFFLDPHRRVRLESQINRGIFVCGSVHRPVDMETAILQGMTAAARAARFVRQGEVRHAGTSAWVDSQACTGCAQCVETCASRAIRMQTPNLTPSNGSRTEGFDHAVVDPFLCLGCGNCVVECPTKAIDLPSASDAQIFAQVQAVLVARHDGAAPVLVFACSWSGFAAMELAGARRMTYPANVRVIELPCSARLDPLHVLFAFYNGAERVMLALCPPNECHFGNGNQYAETRIENLRRQLAAHGIDPLRLQIVRMMGDDADAWVHAVTLSGELKRVSSISFLETQRIPIPLSGR